MNNLIKVAMVLAFAVQASAQSKISMLQITSKSTSQIKDKDFLGNKSKASVGGHDGNGGDTALDPETQKRTLLDLIEKDDMVPVLLDAGQYDQSFQSLDRSLYFYYFTSAEVNGSKFYRTAFGSPAFTYLFLSASGKFDLEPCKTVKVKEDSFLNIHYVPAESNGCSLYATKDFFNFIRSTPLKAKALKWYFTTENLEDIRDEGLIRLEDVSTKKQVAIQKDGVVVINESEFRKMDNRSRSAVLYHEKVIYAVVNLNPKLIEEKGTEPIRTFIRRIIRQIDGLNGEKERVADEWVMESFLALGLP